MTRRGWRLAAVLPACWIMFAAEGLAELKAPKDPGLAAVDALGTVELGQQTTVTLQILDQRKVGLIRDGRREFDFEISDPPKCGRIVSITQMPRQENSDSAIISYESEIAAAGAEDSFEFSAKEKGGRKAELQGICRILIMRPKLKLQPTGTLDFGDVFLGELGRATLRVTNAGNALLSGRMQVSGGFSVPGQGLLALGPGEAKDIAVAITPTRVGPVSGEIVFSGSEAATLKLAANGTQPFFVAPGRIAFTQITAGRRAEATMEIQNRTKSVLRLNLETAPPFLLTDTAAIVMPSSVEKIQVFCEPSKTGDVEGSISVRYGESVVRVPVIARVVPPKIVPAKIEVRGPDHLDFGEVSTGREPPVLYAELANAGGVPWVGAFAVEGPFTADPGGAEIAPGASVKIAISPIYASGGDSAGTLLVDKEKKLRFTARIRPDNSATPAEPAPPPRQNLNKPEPAPLSDSLFLPPETPDVDRLRLLFMQRISGKEPEKVQIRWQPSEKSSPKEYCLLIQKTKVVTEPKPGIQHYWEELADVPCTQGADGFFEFAVDRLRPGWTYDFAVSRRDETGREIARSDPVLIAASGPEPFRYWSIVRFLAGGLLIFGGIGYFLWNYNKWFGPRW